MGNHIAQKQSVGSLSSETNNFQSAGIENLRIFGIFSSFLNNQSVDILLVFGSHSGRNVENRDLNRLVSHRTLFAPSRRVVLAAFLFMGNQII